MTKEEAIIALKRIRKDWQFTYSYDCEAVEIAIRTLKNEQTDGDLIPRQAVITMLNKIECAVEDGDGFQFNEWIDYAKDIPSAEKTAEWIDDMSLGYHVSICSNCNWRGHGDTCLIYKTKYCPNCGCRMKGENQ